MTVTSYALVLSDGTPFSWHETERDAIARQTYERDVFGRYLIRVQAHSVSWPAVADAQ